MTRRGRLLLWIASLAILNGIWFDTTMVYHQVSLRDRYVAFAVGNNAWGIDENGPWLQWNYQAGE